ncbi:trimeric intracellular cation channel family protein [Roseateles amylovorans]|uniref:Trimeric intracellular cation channel family protein n=1 Tax=Roseateles amylovorans TaxID=2978473 RepID=A0ABY6B293_9BURK|nr:trimeric intracellular cation channel family protein [Roseateles amylovorans]UXH79299.1 trimeric intracellular cation channel family protein [Roseateles amylovorans]
MPMIYWFDLMGVAVFAVSGALAAMQAGLDLFGLLVLAAMTAVGGGTLRDLLLNRHPVFWMKDTRYLLVIIASALTALVFGPFPEHGLMMLKVVDALGLALFALCGTEIAEEQGVKPLPALLMGTLTACGGGVLRDVLSGQAPLLLRKDIYATAAIGGIALYFLLKAAGLSVRWAFVIGMVGVAALRLAALQWNWQLPALQMLQLG